MPVKPSADRRSAATRALAALGVFDELHRVLSLSQIARRAELPVTTAHRVLADLTASRLLVRRPDGDYEIGARLWHLGLLSAPTTLRETALPHMQDLAAGTGHTVHLAVLEGRGALVVERLAGSRTVATRHRPGAVLPLHCTAVGKALLAWAPDAVRDDVLTHPARYTTRTETDPAALRRQLVEIRRSGVAHSAQEHRPGVSSVAVPVLRGDEVVAAVAVIAPLSSPRRAGVLAPLRAAAAAIAVDLVRSGAPDPAEPHPSVGSGG